MSGGGEMFELFYASGGHGGPYHSLEAAREGAFRRLAQEQWVDIRRYSQAGYDQVGRLARCRHCGSFSRGHWHTVVAP